MRFRRICLEKTTRKHSSVSNLSLHSIVFLFSFELLSCIPIVFPYFELLCIPNCVSFSQGSNLLHSHCPSFTLNSFRQSQQTALQWQGKGIEYVRSVGYRRYHIRHYTYTPTSTVTYIGGSTQVDYYDPWDPLFAGGMGVRANSTSIC